METVPKTHCAIETLIGEIMYATKDKGIHAIKKLVNCVAKCTMYVWQKYPIGFVNFTETLPFFISSAIPQTLFSPIKQ